MKKLFQTLVKSLGLGHSQANDQIFNFEQMGRVVPDASRCVQCGVCGYNCPVGIPVRDYANRGLAVDDPACITCGNCIQVCPRGTLRWETNIHTLILDRFPSTTSLTSPTNGTESGKL